MTIKVIINGKEFLRRYGNRKKISAKTAKSIVYNVTVDFNLYPGEK